MSVHLAKDIESVKNKLLTLSAEVEEMVYDAVRALSVKDGELAQKVIQRDREVDLMEVEIEEDCLKILALHQPVAIDLRFIVAILKINNDLERVGDLAGNIARRAQELKNESNVEIPVNFTLMAEIVKKMLAQSIDALIHMDVKQSREVCALDNRVDELHRENFERISKILQEKIEHAHAYIGYLSISRYLERIADLATNIAEDVIYLVTGEIARHKPQV